MKKVIKELKWLVVSAVIVISVCLGVCERHV